MQMRIMKIHTPVAMAKEIASKWYKIKLVRAESANGARKIVQNADAFSLALHYNAKRRFALAHSVS
jgi:hypothetical protein